MFDSTMELTDLPTFYQKMTFYDYKAIEYIDDLDQPHLVVTVIGLHPDAGLTVVVQGLYNATVYSWHCIDEFSEEIDIPDSLLDDVGFSTSEHRTGMTTEEVNALADRLELTEEAGRAAFAIAASKAEGAGLR